MFSSTRSYASLMSVLPRSKRNQLIIVGSLHSEYSKSWRLDRCVVCHRESEAEVGPRGCGIDHSVVPKPCCAVVRAPLRLILLEDGCGNASLLVGGKLFPCARELLTFHRRENTGSLF